MGKTSTELSVDYNRRPVGQYGGSGPSDINNSESNRLEAAQESSSSENLSKDSAKLTNKGKPDKDLFQSSKP
jgi:hypothetical protein